MTFILLNDDRTVHSIHEDSVGSQPIYVVHREFKFREDVAVYRQKNSVMDEWQTKASATSTKPEVEPPIVSEAEKKALLE